MRTNSGRGIKVGSVVKLKSGGPTMTVEAVYRNVAKEVYVSCYWLAEDKRKTDAFKLETVELT